MAFVLVLLWSVVTDAVDQSKFRKCGDTRFCRVYRVKDAERPSCSVDAGSVGLDTATIKSNYY